MKSGKRLCALLLSVVMLLVSVPAVSAANGSIVMNLGSNTMFVNDSPVAIDTDPAIKPQVKTINGFGYTMLPLRAVVESMGGTVAYDSATKNITMTYNGTTVTHVIGTATAFVNGVSQPLAITSYAANNRTYVHLRTIELLSPSITVYWNQNAPERVEINYPQNDMFVPPIVILPEVPVIIDPNTPPVESAVMSLTVYNEMEGVKLEELCLAPEGTGDYGENLLERTMNPGIKREIALSVAPGEYDLLGVDDNGEEYKWEKLELEGEKLYLWLIEDDVYELTDDADYEYEPKRERPDYLDEVSLVVNNQTQDRITELKIYPASDHSEPIYTYSEDIRRSGSVSLTLEDLDEENITIYARYTYYDYAFHGDRHTNVVYSNIKLRSDEMKIILQPYGMFSAESGEVNDTVYFRNESGKTVTDLRVEQVWSDSSYTENLLNTPIEDGETVELEGISILELCGRSVKVKVTADEVRERNVLIDDELTEGLLLSMDRNYKISVLYDADEESDRLEGLYMRNDSSDNFDAIYVINRDLINENEFEYEFKRADPDEFFEDHPAQDPSLYNHYNADDYYIKIDDFERKEIAYIDEWTADDLHECELLVMALSSGDVFYGEIRVSQIDMFAYNILVSVKLNSDDVIKGDVVDTDIQE